jgi:TPR repeat protein
VNKTSIALLAALVAFAIDFNAAWAEEKPAKPAPRLVWGASLLPELVTEYRRAVSRAERGWEGSELGLARLLDYGIGVEPDPLKAIELYKKAAEKKSGTAAQSLGVIYAIGHGVERDVDEADKWFKMAGEFGSNYPCMLRGKEALADDKETVVALCSLHTLIRTLLSYPRQARRKGDEGRVDVGINFKRLEIRVVWTDAPESLQESAKSDLKKFIKVVPMPDRLLGYDEEFVFGFTYILDHRAKELPKEVQSK